MVRNASFFARVPAALSLIAAGMLALNGAPRAHAQAPLPRIHSQIENSPLMSLPGEVHPWARPQYDRGPAPANMSGHMLMVLKRSPEQKAALQELLAEQQDPHSPNYHKWLTPEQLGERFGVADSDVQAVTGYLSAQGMSVGRVYKDRMAIEVSATAGQIRSAFHTEIHAYSVAGKTFYGNNSNPQIPSALGSVVAGFAAMNNFHAQGGSGAGTQASYDPATHKLKPLYTNSGTNPTTYGVSPADLATIYDIPAKTAQGLGGQNVNIGIVGDSDVNVDYINNYRSIFGLSANPPIVVVDGNDPGENNDAYIAYKQIELVGAVAPNAKIYYYTSATTDYDYGIDFALIRAVSDNQVQVLLNGFSQCETGIATGGLDIINSVAEEAAAQGITFVAASGNTGSAGCEPQGAAQNATTGYAVNGYASSPYLTAVGGTDFYYTNPSTYWNTGSTGYSSAISYIPEQVWNDSYAPGGSGNSNAANGASVELAGGGGPSTAGIDGASTPNPMPSYQLSNANAAAIGGNKARVLPDVSFFAGSGANNSEGYNNTAYMFCMAYTDCLSGSNVQFTYSGGTEASSAVFAGAVALTLAKLSPNSPFGLGNVNPTLYSLLPSSNWVHDITRGTNELACSGSTNCARGVMTGFAAGAGYDAATGLGSFDIGKFVSNYSPINTAGSSVTMSIVDLNTGPLPACTVNGVPMHCATHSELLNFVVTASGGGATPTGDVSVYTTSPLQADAMVQAVTLSNGTANFPWNLLPGGTYNIYARYAGDGTYAPSVSTAYPISVSQEACKMVVYGHNVNVGSSTNIAYGSPITITAEPYSTLALYDVAIPSGSIRVLDNGVQITSLPVNSEGSATFSSNLLAFGSHSIVLNYPGDASFTSCSTGAFLANVTKAATTTTLLAPENDPGGGGNSAALGITAVVTSQTLPSNGTSPTGTVTFSTSPAKIATLVPGFDPNGNAIATASIVVSENQIPNNNQIVATYTPATTELNYTGSTSSAVSFQPTTADTNNATKTTFTITDNNGTYPATGTYPSSTNPSFPAQDTLTLNLHVKANNPQQTVFLVYANGVQLTPPIIKDQNGYVIGGGLPIDQNGNATFVVPQQNGYLALPSGQVQFTVLYDGWITVGGFFTQQSDPSTANQVVNIVDDRTSADFSLQTDQTVNQAAPLISPTTTASYSLRVTSIYNFNSAYAATPINLSCSVVGYSLAGVRSTPQGLTCGFDPTLATTTTSVTLGATGYASPTLYVGAAGGYSVATNTVPPQPAARWWMAAGGTTLACIFLFGLPTRRRKWQSVLGACVLLVVGFGMTGCGATVASGPQQQYYNTLNGGSAGGQGGGSGNTVPSGTYTVMITATATTNTTLVHTLPVQVLVGANN